MKGTSRKSNTPPEIITAARALAADLVSRTNLANKMGEQYDGARKIYTALGYPASVDLDFAYFYNKYRRQDIANAVIKRPVDATWKGSIHIIEGGLGEEESKLDKEWEGLVKEFKLRSVLGKVDKLCGIGRYAILLFGFDDVKEVSDWAKPATGNKKLKYIKQFSELSVEVAAVEENTANERFGFPLFYKVTVQNASSGRTDSLTQTDIKVHHTRILHISEGSLVGDLYGLPRLEPIVNRLIDLEKLLGGDAEMFWRNARPGFQAIQEPGYEMGTEEEDALKDELLKYENDLRRFIAAKGVKIEALTQEVADPLNHIDAQLQAISAQTEIPKRILIGSERGELSSSQDQDQWRTLIKTRREEFAENIILRPFIDKCMSFGILTKIDDYEVVWEDLFTLGDKDKAEIGKIRSEALKTYSDSIYASEVIPPEQAYKYLMGLTDEQIQDIMTARAGQIIRMNEEEKEDDDV